MNAILSSMPQSTQALQAVNGMGPSKVAKYGAAILALCKDQTLIPSSHSRSAPTTQGVKREAAQMMNASEMAEVTAALKAQKRREDMADADAEAAVATQLTEEQSQVCALVEGGSNVFFTGSAGTGKSWTLKHVVKCLKVRYPQGI
jgi:Cdc6-like AAA superfamily ATPase